jgi:putative FmdB family regulatory protein
VPTYGYKCNKCSNSFEVFQKITDDSLTECPRCGGEIHRLLYPVGIVFKGAGFHINDYRKPEKSADSSSRSVSTAVPEIKKPEVAAKKESTSV